MSRIIKETDIVPPRIRATSASPWRMFYLRLKISFRDWLLSTPQEFFGREELEKLIDERDAEIKLLNDKIKRLEIKYSHRTKEMDTAIKAHLKNIANPTIEKYPFYRGPVND